LVQRFVSLGIVLGLSIAILLSAFPSNVQAQDEGPIYFDAIYFPWVPNAADFDGTGPWHGSITIQNLDVEGNNLGVRFWVFDSETINGIALGRLQRTTNQCDDDANDDDADDVVDNDIDSDAWDDQDFWTDRSKCRSTSPYSLRHALEDPDVPHFDLDPNSSVTLNAGILGLPEPGSAVAVFALYKDALGPEAEFDQRPPRIAGVQKQVAAVPFTGVATTSAHLSVDGYSAIPLPDIAWGSQSDFCYAIRDGVSSCDGTGLHTTPGGAASGFDGHSYLPIVQTNSGWDTQLYLSNVDFTNVTAAQVNVTLTESGQPGSAASGAHRAVETVNIPPGGTAVLDIRSLVGNGWVGSAHITSTVGISTIAMRSKPSDKMLMINTAAPSLEATIGSAIPHDRVEFESSTTLEYQQFAPLIFRDFNGWNTGISFVNIAEQPSRISVSFVDLQGNVVGVDSRTVPAQSQEFIYIPSTQDRDTSGFVGAALFRANHPFHVAVDQVKYSTGEAMSYLATAVGAEVGGALSLPLVQKGWTDGSGDTSGFQVFNPSPDEPVTYEMHFFDSSGVAVSPTHLGPVQTTLMPREISTVYTMDLSMMPQNQRGSAVLVPVEGGGSIVGVSNNVNYTVAGDGSVAFNMVNRDGLYRLPVSGDHHE
jgi:hypothetical protein